MIDYILTRLRIIFSIELESSSETAKTNKIPHFVLDPSSIVLGDHFPPNESSLMSTTALLVAIMASIFPRVTGRTE